MHMLVVLSRWTLASTAFVAACGGSSPAAPDAPPEAPDSQLDGGGGLDGAIDAPPLEPIPLPTAIAGPLTITSWGTRPFLTPSSVEEVLDTSFSLGREFFVADWRVAPDVTRPSIDGLGPLAHATSCLACHPAAGRPPSLLDGGSVGVGVLFRLAHDDNGTLRPDPIFGGQLQPASIAGVPAEATITFTTDAAGRPTFSFATHPSYGTLTAHASPRLSPHLAGMGLLEAVDDATLLALEDPDDRDLDGISGRAARLPDNTVGRFGWKAVQPGLRGQTAAAFANDLGITSPDHADDCTAAQTACRSAPTGGAPEVTGADIDAVDIFTRYLGVPAARRDNSDPQIIRGHAVFTTIGCASCHASTLTTSPSATPAVLANVTFHPYTDLLLHDLGPELADPIGEGVATAREWRTPPLWGLGLVALQPEARFLHDGRARTLTEAIRWHGGEAEPARNAFTGLSPDDAAALLAFLASL